MKKILALTAIFLLGAVGYAFADLDVTGTVEKTKSVTVNEKVKINKKVDVNVDIAVEGNQGAEASSLLNQSTTRNTVSRYGKRKPQYDMIYRTATISESINSNTGIVNVNQEVGNSINQANLISAAISWSEGEGVVGFANSQASMEQVNRRNSVMAHEQSGGGPQKQSLISNSILENRGIVNVNQSVGNMNNQANQIVLAVASEALVALSEADLGQSSTGNTVNEVGTVRLDSITNSINGNVGVVNVNQSSGNMNNQSNIISISASVPSVIEMM